ncbi:MAG: DUF7146 domain-containing protein [Acidiferrobacterales bacterium]
MPYKTGRRHPSLSDIKDAARGQWPDILMRLGIPAEYLRNRHGPCPGCGGTDRFRFDDREEGRFFCSQGGGDALSGDGLTLLGHVHGWTFSQTANAVAGTLGMTEGNSSAPPARIRPRPVPAAKSPERTQDVQAKLHALWVETVPISHHDAQPLHDYLSSRMLPIDDVLAMMPEHHSTLRFHPNLPYFEEVMEGGKPRMKVLDEFPALIALVTSHDGRPVTVHRTYLRKDGSGKADVPSPRKLYPLMPGTALSGSAIRLSRAVKRLGAAEGIETAMSVMLATGMPVWPCVSANMLGKFIPPSNVPIVIWAELDRAGAGQHWGEILYRRMKKLERPVRLMIPAGPIPDGKKSVDWADVWVEHGREGFTESWWRRLIGRVA